jgi:hypothetical protein
MRRSETASRIVKRQQGFLPVGLLASPTLWLGIGCALLAFSSWMLYKQWTAALEREAKARGEYAAFRAETERLGDEAKAKADAEIKRQKEVNDGLQKRLKALGGVNAELRAHVERLRERPPERPDGSSVPTRACGPAGADGAGAAESVPLADYRALEARAAYDAQTVMLWREWATAQGLAR